MLAQRGATARLWAWANPAENPTVDYRALANRLATHARPQAGAPQGAFEMRRGDAPQALRDREPPGGLAKTLHPFAKKELPGRNSSHAMELDRMFRDRLADYLRITVRERDLREEGAPLSPKKYFAMRDDASATDPCILLGLIHHPKMADMQVMHLRTEAAQQALQLANRVVYLHNDILGFRREFYNGDPMSFPASLYEHVYRGNGRNFAALTKIVGQNAKQWDSVFLDELPECPALQKSVEKAVKLTNKLQKDLAALERDVHPVVYQACVSWVVGNWKWSTMNGNRFQICPGLKPPPWPCQTPEEGRKEQVVSILEPHIPEAALDKLMLPELVIRVVPYASRPGYEAQGLLVGFLYVFDTRTDQDRGLDATTLQCAVDRLLRMLNHDPDGGKVIADFGESLLRHLLAS